MCKFKSFFVFAISIAMALVSCKEEPKEQMVIPKTINIKGDLGEYFEVVEKEYRIPINENSFEQIITVEIRRKDKDFPFDVDRINPFGTNGDEEHHVGFGIELLGENGPIEVKNATEGGFGGPYSSEDVSSLFKLKKGETGFIRWSIDKNVKEIKQFQITSALEKSNNSNSGYSSDYETGSYSGSSDIDQMLNDYENYVDQYLIFLKKAQKGDMSALSEYPDLLEKAQQLEQSLEQARNDTDFSPTQMKRMVAIQQKLANAAIDMYSN